MVDSKIALEIYEPSGLKGKVVKYVLPYVMRLPIAKKILHGTYTSIVLGQQLNELLTSIFGKSFECSVFWGTPCIDRKITVQVFRKNEILGYCKVGSTERIKELFQHEAKVLRCLESNRVAHVPECLAIEQIDEKNWVFIQSTEKKLSSRTEHKFKKEHEQFLYNLWGSTKRKILFEDTDYYQSLIFLKEHVCLLPQGKLELVEKAVGEILNRYQGKTVDWGVCHRDFTPWNTCIVDNELFVFDFEYALENAPAGLDRCHYFVQTKVFEEKCDAQQIIREIIKKFPDREIFKEYLLDIISLYLRRGEIEDIKFAEQRADILIGILQQ